jgi:crotonobetainyl-CoA:carnitine CoA-transferase CaiB-like acyl-CoA transferase
MTLSGPLSGVRVVEYAQYVAGPLCGVLLADLGAEVVKVEPPGGDGYRHVLPVAPGIGRYFVPLNRGKRSVVLDLKTEEGRAASGRLAAGADVVLHNSPPDRARAFGLDWDTLHAAAPSVVAGVVTSFGDSGPLAGAPAYDLIAQARSGLLTSHASAGDRVPVRAGGIPMADLTAGFLLSSAVLAALLHARETGAGQVVSVSLLDAALAVQLQDLVWLEGEGADAAPRIADAPHLEERAAEIAGGVGMNPYYRCFAAADGFVAVACLNVRQRRALLDLFDLADATVEAPDLVPDDPVVLAAKVELTSEIERRVAWRTAAHWLDALEAAGVPCGPVLVRETVPADPQVIASGLVADVEQPGLGTVRLLASVLGGGKTRPVLPAPELGADTEAVLGALP